MAATDPRQFGVRQPARAYPDRPAAFGLVERDGRLALVHIRKPTRQFHDLPGGAIESGEDAAAAMVREVGEETGLRVRAGEQVTHADQWLIKEDGGDANNRGSFFTAVIEGEDPALKVEDDHTLVWVDPEEALTLLRHDAHAWAVLAWLRRSPRQVARVRGTSRLS